MSKSIDNYKMTDPVLTTIAQGYSNNNMVAEKLFPAVPLPFFKGKIPVFNRSPFIVRDTRRAIGANSNRVDKSNYELMDFEMQERDAEMSIDYLEENASDSFFKLEQKITQDLLDIIAIGKEQGTASVVQNPANYSATNQQDCTSTPFNDENVNPIEIIKAAAEQLRRTVGRHPNTLVVSANVYDAILSNPNVIERVKYSGVRKINTTILSELLDIRNVNVGYAQYSDDGSIFSDVWTDTLILAYVDENEKVRRSEYNPSFGYTLQRKDMPEVDTYYENGGKIKVIRATDNYVMRITCADAGFLLYNCLQAQ